MSGVKRALGYLLCVYWFALVLLALFAFAELREPGCAVFAVVFALCFDSLLHHVRHGEQ